MGFSKIDQHRAMLFGGKTIDIPAYLSGLFVFDLDRKVSDSQGGNARLTSFPGPLRFGYMKRKQLRAWKEANARLQLI